MFIAIENGQFINEHEIFEIAFGQSPNGATILAFTDDGENPRRGDVIDENELHVVEQLCQQPGWVKLSDGLTHLNLNRCSYVVFAHVPTVGDTARVFVAGRQMHFAKDQDVVHSIRASLTTAGREKPKPAVSPDAAADALGSPPASGNDDREDIAPPT